MDLLTVLIVSFIIISIIGTLLHFTHGWLDKGLTIHFFSAVNESTWEHMKMLVAPTILVTVFQDLAIGHQYVNLFNGVVILLIIELISIPLLFEFSKLIFKKVPLVLTILTFYISIFLGLLCEYMVLTNGLILIPEWLALVIGSTIVILFGVFTFHTPRLGIFKDPIRGGYGHKERQ